MNLTKYIEFINTNGVPLADIGINEIALNRNNALIAISLLREAEIPILGGDVYKKQDNKIASTFDNWYCEKDNYGSQSEYVNSSLDIAERYIKNYKSKDSENVFFTLIIPE